MRSVFSLLSISDLFPRAREADIGIQSFYFQVKETLGIDLDDNLWIPFVWDTVYTIMNDYGQGMSQAPYTYVKYDNIPNCDIASSQIWNRQINIEYCESSSILHVVSQHQIENFPSIDIENIAASNNRYTSMQAQPLSVALIYDSTGANQ